MASRSIQNVLGFGLAAILISGCTAPMPQRIEVSAKPVAKPELVLPNADVLRMRKVDWMLITPENFDEKVAEIEATGRPVVFFALTDEGYENISMNFSDVRAFIQQQRTIIAAYENYYKESEQAIEQANKNIEGAKAEVDAAQELGGQKSPGWQFWK